MTRCLRPVGDVSSGILLATMIGCHILFWPSRVSASEVGQRVSASDPMEGLSNLCEICAYLVEVQNNIQLSDGCKKVIKDLHKKMDGL